jgi:hypothetical protein
VGTQSRKISFDVRSTKGRMCFINPTLYKLCIVGASAYRGGRPNSDRPISGKSACERRGCRGSRATMARQRRTVCTAKADVSWSIPTLTQPALAAIFVDATAGPAENWTPTDQLIPIRLFPDGPLSRGTGGEDARSGADRLGDDAERPRHRARDAGRAGRRGWRKV